MNLRNILQKKEPAQAAAPPVPRVTREQDKPAPRRRNNPYPNSPTANDVRQIERGLSQPVPAERTVEDRPDRDWVRTITTALFLLFAIGGTVVGGILMMQPGTPNNLSWMHGENAVVLVCLILLFVRQK